MLETATYFVTRDICVRSGLLSSRYRIADGRFVLNNRDLSRVRFTTDEYINGLEGVERVTKEQAKTAIRQNHYRLGDDGMEQESETEPETSVETEAEAETPAPADSSEDTDSSSDTEETNTAEAETPAPTDSSEDTDSSSDTEETNTNNEQIEEETNNE